MQTPPASPDPNRPRILRFGVIGIGNAGGGVLRAMRETPNIQAVAAADLRPQGLEAFQRDFGGAAYTDPEQLCRDPNVDAVWIATPNHLHCPHAILAAEHGKHIVVEKPMALSLDEAARMVHAAERNNVKLLSGHTRAFDPPVQTMWRIIRSGEVGPIRAMNVMSFTDWMLRPRMPEEVDSNRGGGVAFRQAPHQIDSLRFLGGGLVRSVRGSVGAWMPGRMQAPGYYAAYLEFENGAPATIAYNAYGYFLAAELLPWEMQPGANAADRARIRNAINAGQWNQEQAKEQMRIASMQGLPTASPTLPTQNQEPAAPEPPLQEPPPTNSAPNKAASSSPQPPLQEPPPAHSPPSKAAYPPPRSPFQSDLGLLIVTCERGLLRQSPHGIYVYNDNGLREEPLPAERNQGDPTLLEAYNGIVNGHPIFHDGLWGMATLEVQLAMMQSARERREILLERQIPVPLNLA